MVDSAGVASRLYRSPYIFLIIRQTLPHVVQYISGKFLGLSVGHVLHGAILHSGRPHSCRSGRSWRNGSQKFPDIALCTDTGLHSAALVMTIRFVCSGNGRQYPSYDPDVYRNPSSSLARYAIRGMLIVTTPTEPVLSPLPKKPPDLTCAVHADPDADGSTYFAHRLVPYRCLYNLKNKEFRIWMSFQIRRRLFSVSDQSKSLVME